MNSGKKYPTWIVWIIALLLSLVIGMLAAPPARADITQQKFSFNQVFDVQWYISSGVLHASGFNYLYASQPSNARLTAAQTNAYASAGNVIKFFNSTTNPGTYGLGVYDSTGTTLIRVLDNTGTFTALANGAIFYNGAGMWGTLFTTSQGYSIGNAANFNITVSNPTTAQLQAYVPPTTQPLSSGQTAQASPTVVSTTNSTVTTTSTSGSTVSTYNQPVTITTWSDGTQTTANNGAATLVGTSVTGGGGITAQQQADIAAFNSNAINGAGIYIQQSGNNDIVNIQQVGAHNLIGGVNQQSAKIQDGNNTITIKQGNGNTGKNEIDLSVTGGSNIITATQAFDVASISAGDNYQKVNVAGFSNNVTTSQTNDGGLVGHFAEINVTGNYNIISMTQSNNTQKQAFISTSGNYNTVSTSQSGTGAHYVNVTETGNGNTATVTQTGSAANTATINLINAGAPASVNLTQTGGQSYSITQTCYTNACGAITLRQGN